MRIIILFLAASTAFAQPRWSASRMLSELLRPLFPQILAGILGGSPASGGGGTVAFDNSCSSLINSATSLSCNLTIGSVTNGAVIIGIDLINASSTGIACTVGGTTAPLISGSQRTTVILGESHGLATGSTTGSTTVACSWTGSSDGAMGVMSVSGANQTTPFVNGAIGAGGSNPATITITSATNHLTFSVVAGGGGTFTSPSQTQLFMSQIPFGSYAGGMYGTGASTVVHSWTMSSAALWVETGADIQP